MASRLIPVNISTPAVFGLNRQQSGDILPLEWATEVKNLVINDVGKPASRKGFRGIADEGVVFSQHEWADGEGNILLIFSTANGLFLLDGNNPAIDVTGDGRGGYWEFTSIRGGVYAMQQGTFQVFIADKNSVFERVTNTITGTLGAELPGFDAHAPLAALGRLWCIKGTKLLYTDTLTYDSWDGVFDLQMVWPTGVDNPQAISYFNGDLVIFGEDSTIVYRGNTNPLLIELRETIGGLGCPYPRTIAQVGNDLLFLSRSGVRSLGRTLQDGKMPLGDLTQQIQDYLARQLRGADVRGVQAIFDATTGYYLLMLAEREIVLVLHTRLSTPAGTPPITEWVQKFSSIGKRRDQLFFGVGGRLTEYRDVGDTDVDGIVQPFEIVLQLPWWGIDEDRGFSQKLKNLKRAFVSTNGYTSEPLTLCWSVDYGLEETCAIRRFPEAQVSEYTDFPDDPIPEELWDEVAWYGESEFSATTKQNTTNYQLARSGLVVQLKLSTFVTIEPIVIQEMAFQVKLGRLQAGRNQ